ncbi:MAG: hypothetical protein ACFFAU_14275 [Candidatus Hodarchaeota archaeon]
MKEFNKISLDCVYRVKQRCSYWNSETQCHPLTCPIISQKYNDLTDPIIPKQIIESINNFDNKYLEKSTTIKQHLFEDAQSFQVNGIHQKDSHVKKTHGKTIVTITTEETDIEETRQFGELTKEIDVNHDDRSESVNQESTEHSALTPIEYPLQQFHIQHEHQKTIVITPKEIRCDRCGDPIYTKTCTSIRDPNGGIFYIHPNGQCRASWNKIQEVRKRWLKKRK